MSGGDCVDCAQLSKVGNVVLLAAALTGFLGILTASVALSVHRSQQLQVQRFPSRPDDYGSTQAATGLIISAVVPSVDDVSNDQHTSPRCGCRCCSSCRQIFGRPVCRYVNRIVAEHVAPRMWTVASRVVFCGRCLLNHFSLIGILYDAVRRLPLADVRIQSAFHWEATASSFGLVGNYASIGCLFPSFDVLSRFWALWVAVAAVWVAEAGFFAAWKRRLAVVATVTLTLLDMTYATLVVTSASLLRCEKLSFYDQAVWLIDGNAATPSKTYELLSSDFRVDCRQPSYGELWRPLAVFALCACTAALPVIVCARRWLFRRGREDLACEVLLYLTRNYKEKLWYWQLVIMLRKLLTALVVMTVPTPAANLTLHLYFSICVVFFTMTVLAQPFKTREGNVVEALSIISACVAVTAIYAAMANEAVQGTAVVVLVVSQAVVVSFIVLATMIPDLLTSLAERARRVFHGGFVTPPRIDAGNPGEADDEEVAGSLRPDRDPISQRTYAAAKSTRWWFDEDL